MVLGILSLNNIKYHARVINRQRSTKKDNLVPYQQPFTVNFCVSVLFGKRIGFVTFDFNLHIHGAYYPVVSDFS